MIRLERQPMERPLEDGGAVPPSCAGAPAPSGCPCFARLLTPARPPARRARAGEALDVYIRHGRRSFLRDASEHALFLSRDGTRLRPTAIQLAVKWYGIAAGVWEASPHALRHACATHLLRGGAVLRHVQHLLGHKQIHTTALYTAVDLSDLKKTLKKSHPRERAFQKAHE